MGVELLRQTEGRGLCGAGLPRAESRGVAAKTARMTFVGGAKGSGFRQDQGRGFPEARAEGRGFHGAE